MTVNDQSSLPASLVMQIVDVTEKGAMAAARWCGKGDEKAADLAAVEAMRSTMMAIDMQGQIVIGEGERDEAPMLFIGEKLGAGGGHAIDIAVDPLEGTTLCAKSQSDSLAVVAIAPKGSLLHAPDVYMEKIAIGPGYPEGIVTLKQTPTENLNALARAKGVKLDELTVCLLERPRHQTMLSELRSLGVRIRLISDGDIAGVIHTCNPSETGIDIYMGTGGAPEGVLAAAAMRCQGGQMQGRLVLDTPQKRERAYKMGFDDPDKIMSVADMVSSDVVLCVTGVTDGKLLRGVQFESDKVVTHTLLMHASTSVTRNITTVHALK